MHTDAATLTAILNADLTRIQGGTPPATLEVRTGTRPAAMTDAESGTLLATLTCSNPAAVVSGTTETFSAITADASADASGTPGYVSLKQGTTGTAIHRFTAGVGSGEISFNSSISLGGNVSMSSLVINAPANT